jgi:CBS domain containing-hemolysin-like protein
MNYFIVLLFFNLFFTFKSSCLGAADANPEWTELKSAIKNKNLELVTQLIEEHPALISYQSPNGNTCLHVACSHGNDSIRKLLMRKGADFKVKNNEGNMPFFYLVQKKKLSTLPVIPYVLEQTFHIKKKK